MSSAITKREAAKELLTLIGSDRPMGSERGLVRAEVEALVEIHCPDFEMEGETMDALRHVLAETVVDDYDDYFEDIHPNRCFRKPEIVALLEATRKVTR